MNGMDHHEIDKLVGLFADLLEDQVHSPEQLAQLETRVDLLLQKKETTSETTTDVQTFSHQNHAADPFAQQPQPDVTMPISNDPFQAQPVVTPPVEQTIKPTAESSAATKELETANMFLQEELKNYKDQNLVLTQALNVAKEKAESFAELLPMTINYLLHEVAQQKQQLEEWEKLQQKFTQLEQQLFRRLVSTQFPTIQQRVAESAKVPAFQLHTVEVNQTQYLVWYRFPFLSPEHTVMNMLLKLYWEKCNVSRRYHDAQTLLLEFEQFIQQISTSFNPKRVLSSHHLVVIGIDLAMNELEFASNHFNVLLKMGNTFRVFEKHLATFQNGAPADEEYKDLPLFKRLPITKGSQLMIPAVKSLSPELLDWLGTLNQEHTSEQQTDLSHITRQMDVNLLSITF